MTWLAKILRAGRVVRSVPPQPEPIACPLRLRGSLQLRHVDAGSCNGCEIELSGAFSPVYDAEQFGVRLVASPRHADGLIVTGVVTHNMKRALLKTLEATPEPRIVVALGDCALTGGVFSEGYGIAGTVGDFVPVDVAVPGCPPTPEQIVDAIRRVTGR